MQFNQSYGTGTKHSWVGRALMGLPLLGLSYVARTIFNNIIASEGLTKKVGESLTSGQLHYNGQVWDLPTLRDPLGLLVTVFSPGLLNIDPQQRLQATTFLTDLAPMWLIFILESHRRANAWKWTIAFPLLYGMAFQMFGIGIVGPIWFFLHYLQSPIRDYVAKDWRLINVAAAKTAALAIFPLFSVLTIAMYHLPDLSQRLIANAIWQPFPILTIVLHFILRKFFVTDTTSEDRTNNVQADMPSTRAAVLLFASISAVVFNLARFSVDGSFYSVFFPDWELVKATFASSDSALDMVAGMRLFLQVDELICFSAAILWLAYLINDLKAAEMASVSWPTVSALGLAGTYLIGPGATVVLGWWWRENVLATKFPKGSASAESQRGKTVKA
jgi:hypothetical protein